jgi:hypothetical protein
VKLQVCAPEACHPVAAEVSAHPRDSANEKPHKGQKPLQGLRLRVETMVAGDGIEPPTRGFSIPCSTD